MEGPGSGESGVAAPGETAVEGPASLAGGASGPSQDWSGGGQRPEAVVSVSLPAGVPVQSAPKRKHSASGKKGGSKKKKAHGGVATCPANGAKVGNALDAEQGPATPTPTQPRRSLCVLCRKTGGTACMVVSKGGWCGAVHGGFDAQQDGSGPQLDTSRSSHTAPIAPPPAVVRGVCSGGCYAAHTLPLHVPRPRGGAQRRGPVAGLEVPQVPRSAARAGTRACAAGARRGGPCGGLSDAVDCTSLKLAQAGLWMVLFSSSVPSMICPDGSTPGSDALPSRIYEGLLLFECCLFLLQQCNDHQCRPEATVMDAPLTSSPFE